MADLKSYRFKVSFEQNGIERLLEIQGMSVNDLSAIHAGHILADGLSFCGGSEIQISIIGSPKRAVGTISDKIQTANSEYERQHNFDVDFER